MFEIGKSYRVWMLEGSTPQEFNTGPVLEVNFPLVKFKGSVLAQAPDTIVNVASLAFVKAEEKSY